MFFYDFKVSIGQWSQVIPDVQYCTEDRTTTIAIAITIPIVASLFLIIFGLLHRQRMRGKKQVRERKQILKKLDDLENKTRENARNGKFLSVGLVLPVVVSSPCRVLNSFVARQLYDEKRTSNVLTRFGIVRGSGSELIYHMRSNQARKIFIKCLC